MVETLLNICINSILTTSDNHILTELCDSTYEQRVSIFEALDCHPVADILAERCTLLYDYPKIIGELYPFDIVMLLNTPQIDQILTILKCNSIYDVDWNAFFNCLSSNRNADYRSVVIILIINVHLMRLSRNLDCYHDNLVAMIKMVTKISDILKEFPIFKRKLLDILRLECELNPINSDLLQSIISKDIAI